MSYLLRAITENKNARIFCVDTKDIVQKAQDIHKCSGTAIAALGRLLTAGVIMGAELKSDGGLVTIKFEGDGPLKGMLVTADEKGNIKGYVGNPLADLPITANNKLDVGGIVGKGTIRVIKDLGMKQPYVGLSNIETGEVAEDLAYYYYQSEQVASVIALGVLVNPDLSIKRAGGFMIQLLPEATDEYIKKLEERISMIKPVTALLEGGMGPEEILNLLTEEIEGYEVLEKKELQYHCDCEKEKFYKGLVTLGVEEIKKIFEEEKEVGTRCHFCGENYSFVKEDFEEILK